MNLDQRIRAELSEHRPQWLTWTQLVRALTAALDDLPAGDLAGDVLRRTIARELGIEHGAADQETAVLPPERHSPGQTGHGEGKDTPDKLNEALRATGIKVEDIDPVALREALVQASGPPWGQGRGAYLAGLLGMQFAEDKRREASS